MRKQILADKETKAFLRKSFGCSIQYVWQSLNFVKNGETARRIRKLALERGGRLAGGGVPECLTSHEEGAGTMTQVFSPRVRLVVDKRTGEVGVFVDGSLRDRREGMDIAGFMQLQQEVAELASTL